MAVCWLRWTIPSTPRAVARSLVAAFFTTIPLSAFPSALQYHALDRPGPRCPHHRGRKRKHGEKLGSVTDLAFRHKAQARTFSVFLYGRQREVSAFERVVMLKNLRCPARVVWVFRKTRWVALFTTDMALSVEQIIEYNGARWKIESGF